jgi:nitrogen fixation/metabolism regulation signal transduction histidine kinase
MNPQVEFILGIISSIVITYFIEKYFINKVTTALKLSFPFNRQEIKRDKKDIYYPA